MALDLERLVMEGDGAGEAPAEGVLVHPVDRITSMRGNLYEIPLSASSAKPYAGPSTPLEREERDWTIIMQPVNLPYQWVAGGRKVGQQQTVVALVRYGAGAQTITKSVLLSHTVERSFIVRARYVQVSFFISGGTDNGDLITVSAAVVPGSFGGPDRYAWAMAQAPLDLTAGGQIYTAPGVLGWLHLIMQAVPAGTAPATPIYVVGLDLANGVAPASGTTPVIPGMVSDPFTAAAQNDNLGDDLAAGAIGWTYGLQLWASTTTTVYTAPAAGTEFHAELKAGQ